MTTQTRANHKQSDFERLMRRSRRQAYNLAYRLTGNPTDAEDVVQDAYLRAWANFDSYDTSRSFEGWLLRIITNRVIDLHRRHKRVRFYSLDGCNYNEDSGGPHTAELADPSSDPEWIVVGPVMDERLQRGIAGLSADTRTTFLLADVEERSYQEIAETMHCALGTVRSRIHRARLTLREHMKYAQYVVENPPAVSVASINK